MISRLFSDIYSGVWLIDPQKAVGYMPIVNALLENKLDLSLFTHDLKAESLPRFANFVSGVYTISEYGAKVNPEKAPENSVAVIYLSDVIYKYDMECGPAGMQTKSDILRRCYAQDNIKAVMLVIDSPGGEAYGGFAMAEAIREKNKPVVAFVDGLCASAAYEIASQCDHIVANMNEAQIGSIGTYLTIADYEKYFEKAGIRLMEIYATKSTDKNKPYYDALKGDDKALKAQADVINEKFLSDVKKGRGEKLADENVWGTGKLFFASEALKIGLIDEIDSFNNVIYNLLN